MGLCLLMYAVYKLYQMWEVSHRNQERKYPPPPPPGSSTVGSERETGILQWFWRRLWPGRGGLFSSKSQVSRKHKYQEAMKASMNESRTKSGLAEDDGKYRAAASSSWSPASLAGGLGRHERGTIGVDAEKRVIA